MPITYSQARTIIEGNFSTGWTTTKIGYENVEPRDYSDPTRPLLSDLQAPYIGVKILFGQSYPAEVGANAIKRSWGNIETKFYSRLSEGAKVNADNIDKLANLFEYKEIGGIVFKNIQVLTPGPVEGWYVTPTLLRFYFNR